MAAFYVNFLLTLPPTATVASPATQEYLVFKQRVLQVQFPILCDLCHIAYGTPSLQKPYTTPNNYLLVWHFTLCCSVHSSQWQHYTILLV